MGDPVTFILSAIIATGVVILALLLAEAISKNRGDRF